ncbi:MAG TPA: HPF/RaiA family ribosome-associated protein [Gemmatimonadaceae bacterium]|nr:HPF/RaiA family ribosome-associated protein [Gemmatimonadaceae bacterium]
MDIIFQAHHAVISDRMRLRAERAVRRTARKLSRAVDAVVRFERDGPISRVEILLHAPRHRDLIAEGRARYYGPALAAAVAKLDAQVVSQKRTPKARGRALARR